MNQPVNTGMAAIFNAISIHSKLRLISHNDTVQPIHMWCMLIYPCWIPQHANPQPQTSYYRFIAFISLFESSAKSQTLNCDLAHLNVSKWFIGSTWDSSSLVCIQMNSERLFSARRFKTKIDSKFRFHCVVKCQSLFEILCQIGRVSSFSKLFTSPASLSYLSIYFFVFLLFFVLKSMACKI